MSPASLLICCSSRDSMDGGQLEDWLAEATARFASEEATLYRVSKDVTPDQGQRALHNDRCGGERVWFLAISREDALDSALLDELLAEMRLLGFRPTVLRLGSLERTGHEPQPVISATEEG